MAMTSFEEVMESDYLAGFSYDADDGATYHFIWSEIRVDRRTLPEGWYAFDVRGDEDCGEPCSIEENYVFVNHWGTILSRCALPFPPSEDGRGWLELTEDNWSYEDYDENTGWKETR